MENAEQYQGANALQERDAERALDEFLDQMEWGRDERVMDVGCGPGDVTANVLLTRLPRDVQGVLGVDVSRKMVQHAKAHFGGLDKLSFGVMDITAVPNQAESSDDVVDGAVPRLQCPFTKVFSFFCLHWVTDQRTAMQNIANLLAPGGEALLVYLASAPIFRLWRKMASKTQWNRYMQDVERFVSPYQDCERPDVAVAAMLKEAGLQVKQCVCRDQTFEFSAMHSLQTQIEAVTPFLERMPADVRVAYVDDCMAEVVSMGLVRSSNNNNKDSDNNNKDSDNNNKDREVQTKYRLLIAHARKPLQQLQQASG